jgi:hypothetical protein
VSVLTVTIEQYFTGDCGRRESVADVVTVQYDLSTGVSIPDLERKLAQNAHRKLKIGAFSAASNVTGE